MPGFHPLMRRAIVVVFARRSVSACALPRPSATASARLANNTVSHSHTVVMMANAVWSRIANQVVKTEPISTMNITGFLYSVAGFSLRNASGVERHNWCGSRRPPCTRCAAGIAIGAQQRGRGHQCRPSANGPSASAGKYVRATTMSTTPTTMPMNKGRCVGNVPSETGTGCWRASDAGEAEREDHRNEPGAEHHDAKHGVVPVGVHADAGERRPVVVTRRGEGVQHFGQPVRAGVLHRRPFTGQRHRHRRADEYERRRRQEVQRGELHLARRDLLAQVLRRSTDHQAGRQRR